MRFDKLQQAIAAGGIWSLNLMASDFHVVAAEWPLTVTLSKGGAVIGTASNVIAGDYFRGLDFDRIDVSSATAQTVTVVISDGESGSGRIIGEVSVINGERSRVKAGSSFVSMFYVSPGTGNYAAAGLFNPANSGVNVFLESFEHVCTTGPASTRLVTFNADLGFGASSAYNKRLGGAVSKAISSFNYAASVAGWTGGSPLGAFSFSSFPASAVFDLNTPVMIPPGFGIAVYCETASTVIRGNFMFSEEPVT